MEMFAFLSSNEFANEIDVVFMCAFVIFGIHIEIVTRQFIFSLSLNRNKMCLSFLRQVSVVFAFATAKVLSWSDQIAHR